MCKADETEAESINAALFDIMHSPLPDGECRSAIAVYCTRDAAGPPTVHLGED
jgi:hypothetical protein